MNLRLIIPGDLITFARNCDNLWTHVLINSQTPMIAEQLPIEPPQGDRILRFRQFWSSNITQGSEGHTFDIFGRLIPLIPRYSGFPVGVSLEALTASQKYWVQPHLQGSSRGARSTKYIP